MAHLFDSDWKRPAWMPADWLPSHYNSVEKRPAPDDFDAMPPESKRPKIATPHNNAEKRPAPGDSGAMPPEPKRPKIATTHNNAEKRPAPEDSGAVPPEPKRTKVSPRAHNSTYASPNTSALPSTDPQPTTSHSGVASGSSTPPPVCTPSGHIALLPDQETTTAHEEVGPNPGSPVQCIPEQAAQSYASDDDEERESVLNCTQPLKPLTAEPQSHTAIENVTNEAKRVIEDQISHPRGFQEAEKTSLTTTNKEENKQEASANKRRRAARGPTRPVQKKLDRIDELQAEKSLGDGWNARDEDAEKKQKELATLLKWKAARERRETKKLVSVQTAQKEAKDAEEPKNMTEEQRDIEEKLRAIANGEDKRVGEAFGELTNADGSTSQADADPATKSLKKDTDLSVYDPIEHHVFAEGEEHFGKYHSQTTFECDPCPEEFKYSKIDLHNDDNLEHTKANERKIRIDGQVSKKKHRWAGVHVINGIFERRSAAHKYMEWRRITLRKVDKVNAKKPRLITLIEREPCGMVGEAGKWAGNIRSLKEMLRVLAPGSHITMVVDAKPSEWASVGYYDEWYQAILDMLRDWPKNFDVKIEDDSILNTVGDGEQFCRKFVKDVNHLHEHGSLP